MSLTSREGVISTISMPDPPLAHQPMDQLAALVKGQSARAGPSTAGASEGSMPSASIVM